MPSHTYQQRRSELETYFDRTAVEAWRKLTSTEKVSGIRATVRAGRDQMRARLMSWLPEELHDYRLLDAGCGTGALSMEVAKRGGHVLAIDVAPTLINFARERLPHTPARELIDFRVGDMLSPTLGRFDYVVAMDSLIHYEPKDVVATLSAIAKRTEQAILFTFAPATAALSTMHKVGKLFPRTDRSPAIQPTREAVLRDLISKDPVLSNWEIVNQHRVKSGFYISQAMHLRKREGAAS